MQKLVFYILCFLLIFTDCCQEKHNDLVINDTKTQKSHPNSEKVIEPDTCELEKLFVQNGLVNIESEIPGIYIDLKYSGNTNFMNRDMYGNLNRVYLQHDVCAKLNKAQYFLKKQDSTLSLLVFDGVRPLRIQKAMWNEFKLPAWKKGKFLSNPAYGSLHNYGAAVDLTICDAKGKELDMGTSYDDTARLAYPELEGYFLTNKQLTKQQVKNRQLLRNVMYGAGFFGIQTEWWHFNSCTRDMARQRYKLIE
jgi:D-alanyl-D-alanine dipeptidase